MVQRRSKACPRSSPSGGSGDGSIYARGAVIRVLGEEKPIRVASLAAGLAVCCWALAGWRGVQGMRMGLSF